MLYSVLTDLLSVEFLKQIQAGKKKTIPREFVRDFKVPRYVKVSPVLNR